MQSQSNSQGPPLPVQTNLSQQQKVSEDSEQPQQQQHLVVQSNATNIQQNQLIGGAQSGTSIKQHSKVTLQQSQQSISVLPSQVQQSQQQSHQQMMSNLLPKGPNQIQTQQQSQMTSQMQLQPVQSQQQLGDAFEDAGSILVNISRSDAGRKLLLEPERGLIKEILKEFDSASPVRRKGVCVFFFRKAIYYVL